MALPTSFFSDIASSVQQLLNNGQVLKTDALVKQTEALEFQSGALIGSMQARAVSKGAVEGSHAQIMDIYKRTMAESAELKAKIPSLTNRANEEAMFSLSMQTTDLETRLERALTHLNDTILTVFPMAKIEYGRPCIGPKGPSVRDTNDAKFQDLLSKHVCLREIRGDGNCFVTAMATRFIESIAAQKSIGNFIDFVSSDGIDQPEIKQEIITTLLTLQEYPSQLENILKDNQKILPFVAYFRHLAADEMKKAPDDFEVRLRWALQDEYRKSSDGPFNALVDQNTLSMGTDFCFPMILALCRRLQFNVRIHDVNPNAIAPSYEVLGNDLPLKGTFCRSGAHYFVLYTPEESKPALATPANLPAVQKPSEITVKCQVPFGHNLFIRGSSSGLSWEKGIPLTQVDNDTWTFRSQVYLEDNLEYKFLIDDDSKSWEEGSNHKVSQGKLDGRDPKFNLIPLPLGGEFLDAPPVRTTKITVKFQAKPGEKLFIRGVGLGPNMSWDKGIELRHIGNDIWVFESGADFKNIEYKLLLNNTKWEAANNHTAECGKKVEITPKF